MNKKSSVKKAVKKQTIASDDSWMAPKFVGESIASAPAASSRTKASGTRWGFGQNAFGANSYGFISGALSPFTQTGEFWDTKAPLELCRKAYWSFPLLKNTIDVMTELSNSRLYLQGGNQRSKDIVGAWLDRIGIWNFKEQFFREFFRSGNVPILRILGEYQQDDLTKMTQVFGAANPTLPIRYIILNPENIKVGGNIAFQNPTYYQVFSSYDLQRLRSPKTADDKAVLATLDQDAIKQIRAGSAPYIAINPDNLIMVFYKKQPYEPMAAPMAFPLLEDINAKLELKRIDMGLARQIERALLLVTAGAEPDKGGINPKTIEALQTLFADGNFTRTLVADYTVQAEWKIPNIKDVLGPEKYTQLDKDIAAGLNSVLFSQGEKFANTSIKVQIFIERLKEARSSFLNNFLQPEIKALCKALNMKAYPEAVFEEINLKDDLQFAKVYAQLAQIGLMTPNELWEAMDTGKLPLAQDNEADQVRYKDQRDKGLYVPLVGGPKTDAAGGRPVGSSAPQATKSVSPVGTSSASLFSATKLRQITLAGEALRTDVENKFRRKFRTKRLSDEQQQKCEEVIASIMAHEPTDQWENKTTEYIKTPKPLPEAIANEIDAMCSGQNVDPYIANVLRLSKIDQNDNE